MIRNSESRRPRSPVSQLDRAESDQTRIRIGPSGLAWAGLAVFVILMTMLLLLALDGRSIVHAAEPKARVWAAAQASGDWAVVRKLARAEVDKNPRDAEAQNMLGMALTELGQFDEAEVPLITAESLNGAVADYKLDLGDLYTRRGNTELAAGKYREALDLDPSLLDVRWKLARSLYAMGELDATLEQLKAITRDQPDNWDAYRLTADVALSQKPARVQDAIDNLKLYTAVVPDARAWAKLAQACLGLTPPDTSGARRAAAMALSLHPGDYKARTSMALLSLLSKNYNVALDNYRAAGDYYLLPRDAFLTGRVYANIKKDLPAAERAFRIAASIDSTNKDNWYELGSNLMSQQKPKDAVEAFERVIDLDPANVSAMVNLGSMRSATGDLKGALAVFDRALTVNDRNAPLWKALGAAREAGGEMSLAREAYQRALENNPDPTTGTEAATSLGTMLWKDGDLNGAVPVLQKALEFDNCNIQALLTLANCYFKQGNAALSQATLQKGLGCPNNEEIRKALRPAGAP